jgi:hypothetical protein
MWHQVYTHSFYRASDFLNIFLKFLGKILKMCPNSSGKELYFEVLNKKSDALVGRMLTFHILQTSELTIFTEIRRQFPTLQNLIIML